MTIPRPLVSFPRRLTDMVRDIMPRREDIFTAEEEALMFHLRGNRALFEALKGLIESHIRKRANSPVPTDPIDCKSSLERDAELRWLLKRLELISISSEDESAEEREHPA